MKPGRRKLQQSRIAFSNWTPAIAHASGFAPATKPAGSHKQDLAQKLLSSLRSELPKPAFWGGLTLDSVDPKKVRVMMTVALISTIVSLLCVIALCILGWTVQRSNVYGIYGSQGNGYWIGNTIVGGLSLIFVSYILGSFINRCLQCRRAGLKWRHRRKRMATLMFLAAAFTALNLAAWLCANIHTLIVDCSWFTLTVTVFNIISWTGWNTVLYLLCMMTYSLCRWKPRSAVLLQDGNNLLIMDAPWTIYLWHSWIWVIYEVLLIVPWIIAYSKNGSEPWGGVIETFGYPNCQQWLWNCDPGGPERALLIAGAAALLLHLFQFYFFVALAHYQLRNKQYNDFRAPHMLLRLQKRSTMLCLKVTLAVTVLLAFAQPGDTCWSIILAWMGSIPIQLSGTTLVIILLFFFVPKRPGDRLEQSWFQDPTWTEDDRSARVLQRLDSMQSQKSDGQAVQEQPPFCVETALKLHRWCLLAYCDFGQKGPEDEAVQREESKAKAGKEGDGIVIESYNSGVPEEARDWETETAETPPGAKNGVVAATDHAARGLARVTSTLAHLPTDRRITTNASLPDSTSNSSTTPLREQEQNNDSDFEEGASKFEEGASTTGRTHGHETAARRNRQSTESDAASTMSETQYTEGGTKTRGKRRGRRKPIRDMSPAERLSTALALYSIEQTCAFWEPVFDTRAVVGWRKDIIIVAFRGTRSMRNALSDLRVWQTEHAIVKEVAHMGLRPMVHSGFYRAWSSMGLNHKILNHLKGLLSEGEVGSTARICLTGHSLGGALAVLAAHDIQRELQTDNIQVVTFGCPYIGNTAFKSDYERRVRDTWHVIHETDPVPTSGKIFSLSKRPGQRVIVNGAGEMAVQPNPLEIRMQRGNSVHHHMMVSYRAALIAVCRMQFSIRGSAAGRAGVLALGRDQALHTDMALDGFEWAEMQKAARWGDQLLVRMAAPKVKRSKLHYACAVLLPIGFLIDASIRWVARTREKHEQRSDLARGGPKGIHRSQLGKEASSKNNLSAAEEGLAKSDCDESLAKDDSSALKRGEAFAELGKQS
ncbi:hypothetical protein WJX73_006415 [Symbiochloris irregularis]|uniref:Fungal lipase-type domain-containing protein n=1 Tax=Symbiochloris irregularis TaxID=706552 RepID=A0AAW1P5Y8_9CHLO